MDNLESIIEFNNLSVLLRAKADLEVAGDNTKTFMNWPDRWLENPLFRCANNHVSEWILKSEARGSLCLACREPVHITFPEDIDGTKLS